MKYNIFDQGEDLKKDKPIEKPNLLERTIHSEGLSDKFRKETTNDTLQEAKEIYNPVVSPIYAMSGFKDEDDSSSGGGKGGGCGGGKGGGCGGGGKKDGSGGGCDKDSDKD